MYTTRLPTLPCTAWPPPPSLLANKADREKGDESGMPKQLSRGGEEREEGEREKVIPYQFTT
jgi:hypothetical protein